MEDQEEDHFEAAAEQLTLVIASGTRFPEAKLLELYALYKQGRDGPCTTSKPYFLDLKGRAKWNAWHALEDLDAVAARDKYVLGVRELLGGPVEGEPMPSYMDASPAVSVPSHVVEAPEEDEKGGPLHAAVAEGDVAVLRGLLETEEQAVNGRDGEGCTPLHLAADGGSAEALSMLLAHGADVDARDAEGLTPLHYAALAEQKRAYLALLEAGANAEIENAEGERAADLAPKAWAADASLEVAA